MITVLLVSKHYDELYKYIIVLGYLYKLTHFVQMFHENVNMLFAIDISQAINGVHLY
jgi:hypothetical protein